MDGVEQTADERNRRRWRQWFPVLGFWQGPDALMADILAGLTVGLVLVPQAMAYAELAIMPPITGLYAASFACMAGAMFGRCAQLQTGPVAMTSLLSFAAIAPLAKAGSDAYLALMAVLAILVGVLRIGLGLIGGSVLVSLISKPVLIGFGTAAGITIASTQVPKFFNVDPGFDNPVFNSLAIVGQLDQAHLPTVLMGAATLTAMILFKRYLPRWPGLLIAMAGAGLASHLLHYETLGGAIVGDLPAGLPPLALPEQGWKLLPELLPGAMMVVIIGLLEVMTVTSTVERSKGVRIDLDGELVGQGAASLVSGCTGGFPVSGSLSRSALNLLAGARTGFSSVVSGALVLLTLLVFTPLLKPLPHPALAAAILMAVTALVKPQLLLATWRIRRSDALFGWMTMLVTLAAAPDMVVGMAVGVGLNVGLVIWRIMRPRCVIVAPDGSGRYAATDATLPPHERLHDGRLVVRIDGRLNFLSATVIGNRIRDWLQDCPADTELVLYACGINDIDATGCDQVADLAQWIRARGGHMLLADVKAPLRERLQLHEQAAQVPILAQVPEPAHGL
ncbi:MAG: SulP family inorganic anion transporter [Planctomycetota bacterium]